MAVASSELLEATDAAQFAHQDQTAEAVEADVRTQGVKDLGARRGDHHGIMGEPIGSMYGIFTYKTGSYLYIYI